MSHGYLLRLPLTDLSDGSLTPGMMVRAIGDPARVGTFRGVAENAGRAFAVIAFPNATQRIPIEQLEPVPLGPDEPTALLSNGFEY